MTLTYSFPRYLAAKKSVDDRALNTHVWAAMRQWLRQQPQPVRILEIGAGIGTMAERMDDAGLLTNAHYTAVDTMPENIATAQTRLASRSLNLSLQAIDLFDFMAQNQGQTWDMLIAHAFLDLMDIPATLPKLFQLLRPGGGFYFTLNFDGTTILEPTIDARLDARIEALYHRSMDTRTINGKQSGDSKSGRHLFPLLRQAGSTIMAAGSSDWVVFAGENGYPADEAYFLHFILHFFETTLTGHPELDAGQFANWLAARRAQIAAGELVYIAHQLDFFGIV
ncbi:MAG: class I SAM-dependent methyltransferase [Candidatus Promineifilaceae bacterium]